MEKYFECFNCKDLMGTVYESKCCGVLYCQKCKEKLTNTHCLKCKKLLQLQRNKFAQRLLKNINVNCKYNCGVKLSYDKMKQHLLTCDKKIYICSFDKIYNDNLNKQSFKGNKKEILDHLVKEHSHILLLFMENHQNFEPILKKLIKKNFNNNEQNKEDTILDLTNSGNFNLDFFRNNESDGNTSIDLDQDIRLLNGINDLNIINSNIQNFNDLQFNNHNRRRNNHNHQNRNNNNDIIINNRINSLNSGNSDNENDNENINLNNNINLLDVDLSRNHYQPLRELRLNSLFNDNENDNENDNINLDYRFNIVDNNNSEHNSNNINGHNTRNRRRIGNLLNNNQNNNNNNLNSNIINNGANNINSQNSNNF